MVWLKLLGVLCAGVFIGAALVETVRGRHGEAEPSDADPSREGKARQAGPEAARREPP